MNDAPCDRCRASSDAGHAYCTKCGRPVTAQAADAAPCEQCRISSDAGNAYCTKCGKPLAVSAPRPEPPKKDNMRKAISIVGLIILAGCTAMLVFELYAVFWGMEGIWTGMENYRLGVLFLTPFPVILFYMSGIVAKFYYLFLVAAVVVSFVMLMYNSREGIARAFKGKLDKLDEMPLYGVVTMFAMYISINMILVLLVTSAGYDPAGLEDPEEEWMLWYALLNASVWEEILCRVLLIGLPLMIAGLILNESGSWKRLFGHSEMNKLAVFLIIFSAAIFAFGHLDGWDLFKVVPTFVCGLALGYLFVRYGLYASIMLHFLIDYMSSVTWIFGSSTGADEIITTAELMLVLFALSMVVLGIPFIVRYAKRGLNCVRKMFLP
ncbi:MAG: CPBP family intramembrane metalloprotease [Methanomassiliicoccaceae archaeon]|jgi:hypothetical protein|nr:CPBP family intramembrane metalloprotease [Methanomassiliicoccaceae archaeon]